MRNRLLGFFECLSCLLNPRLGVLSHGSRDLPSLRPSRELPGVIFLFVQVTVQLLENRARQARPEVCLREMPCIEPDLADLVDVHGLVMAARRLRQVVDLLLDAFHEEALAGSPVAENAD